MHKSAVSMKKKRAIIRAGKHLFLEVYFFLCSFSMICIEEVTSGEKLNDTEPLDVVFALSNTSMTLFAAFPRTDVTIRGCTRGASPPDDSR